MFANIGHIGSQLCDLRERFFRKIENLDMGWLIGHFLTFEKTEDRILSASLNRFDLVGSTLLGGKALEIGAASRGSWHRLEMLRCGEGRVKLGAMSGLGLEMVDIWV